MTDQPGQEDVPQYPPPYRPPYEHPYPAPYQPQPQPPYAQQYPAPYPGPYGWQPYPGAPLGRSPRPSFPHDRPRPYHQMLRTWDYHWWRPLVGMIVTLVGFVVVVPLVALPILLVGAATESGDFLDNLQRAGSLEEVTPATMLYLNATLGGAILLTWFVVRFVHGMRPRWLASVMPKLRWNFLFVCIGISVVALVASLVVGALLPGSADDQDLGGTLNDFTSTSAWIALIVLLTTPFQAAGEEYVFRGYLLQAIGSFVQAAWWKWATVVLTALAFATAHGLQNPPLFFDRFMFGFIAGWLVIRTGGLEAGIAMHILNNYLAFGLALAFGDISESLNVSEVSWWNIVITLTQSVVYAALVLLAARRMNLQTMTRPPIPVPGVAPTPTPA